MKTHASEDYYPTLERMHAGSIGCGDIDPALWCGRSMHEYLDDECEDDLRYAVAGDIAKELFDLIDQRLSREKPCSECGHTYIGEKIAVLHCLVDEILFRLTGLALADEDLRYMDVHEHVRLSIIDNVSSLRSIALKEAA